MLLAGPPVADAEDRAAGHPLQHRHHPGLEGLASAPPPGRPRVADPRAVAEEVPYDDALVERPALLQLGDDGVQARVEADRQDQDVLDVTGVEAGPLGHGPGQPAAQGGEVGVQDAGRQVAAQACRVSGHAPTLTR